jgi:hypothetical protein
MAPGLEAVVPVAGGLALPLMVGPVLPLGGEPDPVPDEPEDGVVLPGAPRAPPVLPVVPEGVVPVAGGFALGVVPELVLLGLLVAAPAVVGGGATGVEP